MPYWDGGYLGNPALFPLFYRRVADDILLVQINPIERARRREQRRRSRTGSMRSPSTANLLNQLRAIDFVKTRLIEKGKLSLRELQGRAHASHRRHGRAR